MPIWAFLVLLGGFLFFGVLCTRAGLPDLRRALASRTWPSTLGKITWAKDRTHRTKGGRLAVEFVAKYDYIVAGTRHEGRWQSLASTRAKSGQHPYATQQDVTVYYAPEDASVSRLERGVKFRDLFLVLGGSVFLAGAGIIAVVYGVFR